MTTYVRYKNKYDRHEFQHSDTSKINIFRIKRSCAFYCYLTLTHDIHFSSSCHDIDNYQKHFNNYVYQNKYCDFRLASSPLNATAHTYAQKIFNSVRSEMSSDRLLQADKTYFCNFMTRPITKLPFGLCWIAQKKNRLYLHSFLWFVKKIVVVKPRP